MFKPLRTILRFFSSRSSDSEVARIQYLGGLPVDMPAVSSEGALKISAVFSAVKLISEGIARLPLGVYRHNDTTKQCVLDVDSQLYNTLRWQPNADMNSFNLWRFAIQQMLLLGNAYLLPRKNVYGDIEELLLLSPHSVYFDVMRRRYTVEDEVNSIRGTFGRDQIVHLRNVSVDGLQGESTIAMAAKTLGIMILADNNTANTLSSGGRIKGLLSGAAGPNALGAASKKQLESVSDDIEEKIRAGRTVVSVPEDMKFQPITLSPADAKVLESKQITVRDIARFFRVHPDLLYEGSNNTYKAAEVPNVMFLTQTLEPMLVQIELELLTKLVPRQLWGRRKLLFDREAMYSTDLSTKSSYYSGMLSTGIYTVNELRKKEGQAPVPGGDNPLVSANLRTLQDIITDNIKTDGQNQN